MSAADCRNLSQASSTASANKAKLDNYPNTPLEIPLASEKSQGLMSAEDKTRLNKMEPVAEVTWTAQHHMNAYTEFGEFHIKGERTNASDGLPILNANPGHTIDAMLTVLDSSLTNGTGKNTDVCVTQILRMSNRKGGDGHIWIRTGQGSNKSNLTWSTWEKLQGIFEKNTITDGREIDTFTTNGIYSCMYVGPYTSIDGYEILSGATLLIIVINGYMASSIGQTPQLTQSIILTQPQGNTNYIFTRHAVFTNNSWNFDEASNIILGSIYAENVNIGTACHISGGYRPARINIGTYADGKVNINNAFIGKGQEIIGTNADSVVIDKGVILGANTKLRDNIRIERNTEIGSHNIIGGNIRIGTNVSIGTDGNLDDIVHISPNVHIYDAVHIGKNINIANYTTIKNDVSIGEMVNIGDNVNIGQTANIGEAVNIGRDVVIGQGANINGNIDITGYVNISGNVSIGSCTIGTNSINFYDHDIPTGFIQFNTDEGLVIFQSKGKSYTLQLS